MSNTIIDRLTADQLARLETASHGEIALLAELWEINSDSLRGALSRYRSRKQQGIRLQSEPVSQRIAAQYQQEALDLNIPEGIPESKEKPLHIPTDNVLVLSDLHCPHHNAVMLRRAVSVCRKHFPHVKDVAFIGDIFNLGQISSHPKTGPSAGLVDEKLMVAKVLRGVLSPFEHAWICNGNHDERVAKKLDMPLDLEGLIYDCFRGDLPNAKLHISNLDWMLVDGDRPWKLAHPSNHSAIGGKTACDIAQLEQINVILGHNHRAGRSFSADGKWEGIDNGHCTNSDFHFYVQRRATKYARWSAGFTILSFGYAHTFTEVGTDWALMDVDQHSQVIGFPKVRTA